MPYLWTCSEWVEFRCDNWEWKNEIETKQDYPYVLPCVVWTPNNCEATTINNYSIPQTNHNTKTNPTPTKTDTTFTNWTKILSQNFICNNWNFQLEWSESFEITNCNSWYYNNNWTSCETQWSWDATNGYVFKNTTWTTTYPKSCNDLLVSTIPNFKVTHTNSPYSSWTNKFVDWVYFIKPDTSDAFKVYCDMTTDWGGWTVVFDINNTSIFSNATTTLNYMKKLWDTSSIEVEWFTYGTKWITWAVLYWRNYHLSKINFSKYKYTINSDSSQWSNLWFIAFAKINQNWCTPLNPPSWCRNWWTDWWSIASDWALDNSYPTYFNWYNPSQNTSNYWWIDVTFDTILTDLNYKYILMGWYYTSTYWWYNRTYIWFKKLMVK